MRIFRKSAAWILLQTGVIFGQLPYHALKLVIRNYELMQDAFQKLCRAGYLEVVKATGHKSFFVTDAGFEAYCRMLHKEGHTPNRTKPAGTRSLPKAIRLSRINEARLFFVLLCGRKYRTSLQIKREQERQVVRSADSLKYSRFVGCTYDEERFLHPVYHFGNGNQRLNPNGEKNAAVRLAGAMMSFEKVILVETPETIADILEYSLWALRKDSRALRHMKLNFHITWEDNAILLPLDGSAQAFVQHFDRKDWRTSIAQIEEQEKATAGITLSLLQGQWMELLEYLARESDPEYPVCIIAWDFQQPVLRVLRERGMLPAKAQVGVCLLQAK
ncbi:hypothetical protein H8S45_13240 [Agathobaculum sp. NSJ-28]|uniref:Uncharacterized protein n=1 Tax=Agathobaculum faecis TaxID=2763013 RepID=A0A923RWX9_9FIRM|nr:hypothetical protein [Agathobaculum faecis]MBC5726419.1 hypothetical protein [Agathobaculum faecis]